MSRLKDLLDPVEVAALRDASKDAEPDNPLYLDSKRFDEYLNARVTAIVQERTKAGDSISDALAAAQIEGHMLQHAWELRQALQVKAERKHQQILKRHGNYSDYSN